MCMFWKRFMKCETKPAEDADDFESEEYQLAQATIKSLKEQLEYQTDMAQSFCKRVHELEQQIDGTNEEAAEQRRQKEHCCQTITKRECELQNLRTYFEKQVAELTRGREYFKKQYRNASESLAEIAERIIAYHNCSRNLPTLAESPIGDSVASCAELAEEDFVITERDAKVVDAIRAGDSVGEETQVFDRSAVKLPDGFVDSAGYGEA